MDYLKHVTKLVLQVLVLLLVVTSPVHAQEDEAASEEVVSRYVDLKPAFTVNYGGVGKLRYLKTSITLRVAGGEAGHGGVRRHMPYIRHTLVMLLSKATEEDLSSMEGKELLRQNALEAVRTVLMKEEGEQFVLDLLFSSFIVQK